jgi:hypothetical protein
MDLPIPLGFFASSVGRGKATALLSENWRISLVCGLLGVGSDIQESVWFDSISLSLKRSVT